MKSQALQEMVKKIFSDETTKKEFMANPNSVISRYNLSEHEKTAVLNTSARFGLATSNSATSATGIQSSIYWM
jgi:hypothetical protein